MKVTATLTRQELYDRVWQTPMVKIAAEYGISGRGLAKLCERYEIPVPGRGHWAMKKAGYEVEQDPLPADPSPDTPVQISGDPTPEREEHPDVAAQIAYEAAHPIVVPEHLHRPHRLVTRTRESLRPSRPDAIGAPPTPGGTLEVRVSRQQLPRALRIFDALLKACEERGFSIVAGEERHSGVKIKVRGEELSVSIPSRIGEPTTSFRPESRRSNGRDGDGQFRATTSHPRAFSFSRSTDGLRAFSTAGPTERSDISKIVSTTSSSACSGSS
jgi:hypothetical protein